MEVVLTVQDGPLGHDLRILQRRGVPTPRGGGHNEDWRLFRIMEYRMALQISAQVPVSHVKLLASEERAILGHYNYFHGCFKLCGGFRVPSTKGHSALRQVRLELELIETQMTQKPMLRAEVGMRVRCANKASAECIMRGRGIGQNSRENCKKRGMCG